jgi:hypothetical protein
MAIYRLKRNQHKVVINRILTGKQGRERSL